MNNQEIEFYLQKWIDSKKIPHSLLFSGSIFSPCESSALSFASRLVGYDSGPDLYCYRPEGKLGNHSIESMRHLKDEVNLPPYHSEKKVFIIFSADRMLAPSANSLLKTFEEPPLASIIILVTHHPEKLLPTVRSRCQTVHFHDEKISYDKYLPEVQSILSSLQSMSPITLFEAVAKLTVTLENASEIREKESIKEETSYQKHLREKEEEGKSAMKLQEETNELFLSILNWCRDLHAVHLVQAKPHLFYPSAHEVLQQQVDQAWIPDLDKVNQAIEKAKLALARSNPLKHALESLFLAIKLSI